MMPSKQFARNLKGAAGVHFVVAQLSLRGFVALATTRNLKSFDVVAFQPGSPEAILLQVKSTDKPSGGWPVYTVPADENWERALEQAVYLGDHFFYVFVELPNKTRVEPAYFVVPSHDVVRMLQRDLNDWLIKRAKPTPGKQLLAWEYGGVKPETVEKYQDRWDLLSAGVGS